MPHSWALVSGPTDTITYGSMCTGKQIIIAFSDRYFCSFSSFCTSHFPFSPFSPPLTSWSSAGGSPCTRGQALAFCALDTKVNSIQLKFKLNFCIFRHFWESGCVKPRHFFMILKANTIWTRNRFPGMNEEFEWRMCLVKVRGRLGDKVWMMCPLAGV